MARITFAGTKRASGDFSATTTYDAVNGATVASTKATVNSAMATLQAQGAAPTEAQVDTTDTALIAFVATVASPAPAETDVVLSVDLANVTTLTQLRKALNALLIQAEGSGRFTP